MSRAQQLKTLRNKTHIALEERQFEDVQLKGTKESYYEKILLDDDIEKAVEQYKFNMDQVTNEFQERTGLQSYDIGFLMFATLLQCVRIYAMNKLTQIEKANAYGGKEDKLHDLQHKIFSKFHGTSGEPIRRFYAPLEMILTNPGVPYDTTTYLDEKFGLFKGANHRFATLGHDPILGLIFGTANILTNSITCMPAAITHHVVYDSMNRNPKIGSLDSTCAMLREAGLRFENDIPSGVAAVIKQLIHIATDVYTPCGIQLPGANLVLSNTNVDQLTKYISTGDVVKAGASAGLATLINTIIAAVHGCKLLFEDDGTDYAKELYAIRTRKIVLYSNVIATSSNVIATGISGNIKDFDLGGFMVTCYRLFSDTHFIDKIKYEFINSQVSKIYDEKVKDINKYYT